MRRFASGVAAGLLCAAAAAAATPGTHVLATYKVDAALEGLAPMPDGAVLVTSNFDRRLLRLSPAGTLAAFTDVPIYPQVVSASPDGYLLTGHGKLPFADGKMPKIPPAGGPPMKMPSFRDLDTQLLVLDRAGHVIRRIAGPADAFFNGLALGSGLVLIADSLGGRLFAVDLAHGTVAVWLADPLLLPAAPRPFPGANGLKIHGGAVYVSNTTRNGLYRVRIGSDGRPSGSLSLYASLPFPDDFDITANGTVLIPSAGDIDAISPAGLVSRFAVGACGGCDTAMLRSDGRTLVLATHGAGVSRIIETTYTTPH